MGRLPRPTGDDLIYHAINRGNNRADVLGPEGERDMFLGDLARTKARYPFALFGYCLMSNHFHLLLKPAPGQSISRILQSLTVAHTWRHHRRQGTSGHVWQGRFRSPVIQDGDHLLVVLRYIEANPVRAAMVADPCEYTWSSHRCHGAGHADPILDSFPEWEQLGRTEPERRARWRRKVRGEQPAKELDGVRSSVRSGRPYGAEDWVEVISHRLGIVREPRRRGSPPLEKMLWHRNSPPLTPEFAPSDTGIRPGIRLTPEFAKRCSDTEIPRKDALTPKFRGHRNSARGCRQAEPAPRPSSRK